MYILSTERENTVLHWAFKMNSVPAAAEMCPLKATY
jgi:hypothetical protein